MPLAASSRAAFIDANVPMYASGADHPLKEPCMRLWTRLRRALKCF